MKLYSEGHVIHHVIRHVISHVEKVLQPSTRFYRLLPVSTEKLQKESPGLRETIAIGQYL